MPYTKTTQALLATAALALAATTPPARAADAYIESDGTQVLNTGYHVGPQTRIVADYSLSDTSLAGGRRLFGVYRRGVTVGYFFNANGNHYFESGTGSSSPNTSPGVAAAQGTRRTVTVDLSGGESSIAETDGTVRWSGVLSGAVTNRATTPLVLFTTATSADLKNAVGNAYMCPAKIYSLKIYEGETMKRDFEPALRDGVAGLHDAVTGVFISAADIAGDAQPDSPLAYGGDIKTISDPYIEATGSQAFLVNYRIDGDTKIVCDYAFTEDKTAKRLFGVYRRGATTGYYQNGAGEVVIESGDAASVNTKPGLTSNLMRHTVTLSLGNAEDSSIATGFTTNWSGKLSSPTTASATAPLCIFSTMTTDTAPNGSYYDKAKIYRFRIYNGETLVHDFVPYVREGVAGFADAKNGNAFLAPFTGTPLYGGAIEGKMDASLATSANNTTDKLYFNTGYRVKSTDRIVADFQYRSTANGGRLFGVYHKGATIGFYIQNGKFRIESGNASSNKNTDFGTADTARHTIDIDLATSTYSFDGATAAAVASGGEVTADATAPLAILDTTTSLAPSGGYCASAKLYSLRIYNRVGALVHEYLPYSWQGTLGLYDTVDKTPLTQAGAAAAGPVVTGMGTAEGVFAIDPVGGTVDPDGTFTLTAFAPGAVSYQWYKDGEAIDGATGMTYAAPHERKVGTRTYTVEARCELYGATQTAMSAEAVVEMLPSAFVLVFR